MTFLRLCCLDITDCVRCLLKQEDKRLKSLAKADCKINTFYITFALLDVIIKIVILLRVQLVDYAVYLDVVTVAEPGFVKV